MTPPVTVRVAAARLDDVAHTVLAHLAVGQDVVVELVAPGGLDLAALDRLGRLVLTARRLRGGQLQLRPACGDLRRLAELTGFCAALPFDDPPVEQRSGEPEGQAEPLEDLPAEGLEEVVEVGDPPV
jgi:hypothetical protein